MKKKAKRLNAIEAMLPNKEEHLRIGYTSEQLNWCYASEAQIWSYFVNNEILYSADFQMIKRFTMDGPFTNAFSKDSPGGVGTWIGLQIVKNYMEHNPEISLTELLLEKDSQKILTKSRYKPKR